MRGVNKRVSASVALALIIGFGALAALIIQAGVTTFAAETTEQPTNPVGPGIRLKFQVDKSIYRAGETVLLALRNDSRKSIWLAEQADGCAADWWQLERLQADGETWAKVILNKQTCVTLSYGSVSFVRHTLKTGQWDLHVPGPQLGDVVIDASVGTYRFSAPYLSQSSAPSDQGWQGTTVKAITSPIFTVQ